MHSCGFLTGLSSQQDGQGLAAKVNIVSVIVLIPMLILATLRYGAIGAAWVWVVLNLGYLTIGIHFMYRRLLNDQKLQWYLLDLLLPITGALAAILLINYGFSNEHITDALVHAVLSTILGLIVSSFIANKVKTQIIKQLRQVSP
jgi:hypothetical protein